MSKLIDELMQEVTLYGGLPMRRCDVLRLASETWGKDLPPNARFGPDYFAFRFPAVDLDPWPIEEVRKLG